MHSDPQRVIDRAARILRERIRPAVEVVTTPLSITIRDLPGEPEPFGAATGSVEEFRPAYVGDPWGPAWTTSWLHLTGSVPGDWRRAIAAADTARDRLGAVGPTLVAIVDIGFEPDSGPGFQCEGLVHRADGSIVKGIHPRSQWVPLSTDDGTVGQDAGMELWVEAAANPDVAAAQFRPTHLGDGIAPDGPPLYELVRADLAVLDPETQALEVDLEVLLGWAEELPADRPRRVRLLRALDLACDALDLDDVRGTATAARAVLAPELAKRADASAHRLAAIGHAHIDSAWLWPTRETVRKATRTFSNVLDLMDRYPEFRFACSQPQQYAWIEQTHPDLFARITAAVARGQWIPAGGMWVESDTNLPGGEALVRQMVHGKRYFADRFGFEPEEVWLPDSFGYTAALPQIASLAGYRWFLTQKLSWGTPTDRFPHHTFRWQGIDGTTLFSHMPPVDSYLSELTPRELQHASSNFRDHGDATTSIVPFGHGDGGGGPTIVMMERARRQADLEGSPVVEHATPRSFFEAAEREYPNAPTWVGELYLEGHRGTYTSQAAMKQGNRRSEHLLREAELWSTTATLRYGAPYPYDALDRLWKTVLLHQFHDILPGSSIGWVHRQAAEAYAAVRVELESVVDAALDVLAGTGGTALAFNAGSQETDGVPALGAGPTGADPSLPSDRSVDVRQEDDATVLDNGVLRVVVDRTGGAVSVRDLRRGRELVAPGARVGDLVLHQDLPNAFDAWDVDEHYLATGRVLDDVDDLRVERAEDGSATIVVERHFGRSSSVQRTTLRPGAAEIDYVTEVDWHEAERFLKVAFPLDVRTDVSTSEIQFGHIQRPTHQNTTWDAAKFEIAAHRWVHVGEPGFGVAIANDSTYGHDVRRRDGDDGGLPGTEVRLSLLRAPRYPDPEADQGRHRFAYRLVSDATIGDAVTAGHRLNLPLRERSGAGPVDPVVRVDGVGVVVESVKLAEDRSGDLVVRLYESLGSRTAVTVHWDVDATGASVVDLLERELERLADAGRSTALEFRPFQIITLRISRGAELEEEIG
ncbi:glycoside hydrolase family 38 C-terminal domain-containing protein [Curtobacterium sp. Leaf261]|uniref:glycoside hydrolase family 38 N-terminal domain-containing protein n=1 Tax=Curtobacterium sp. Leaf261 TaxID=1736311 RepID=UPI0006F9CE50|nr:glycoside hydrolase family 38 C-terminal domain-containing protein [Curtobacterium sp. Leaf261]KQO63740.1 alpha-mannosidase [Curtobacterium sp. Leaf261]